jgi:hypothetical protein
MKGWWRRIRGALGLGVVWAGGGAFIGGLIELVSNLFPDLPLRFIDMWIPLLAVPGFVGGVCFSVVLGIAARRRRFDELSLPLVAGIGAVGGLLLGGLMVAGGVSPLILAPATLLSVVGASLSLTIARAAEHQELLEAGDQDVDSASRARIRS